MKHPFQKLVTLFAIVTLLCGTGVALAADEYPSKPVKVVVAFAPGGTTDLLTRMVSARLTEKTKQLFTVESKPGAGGNIGTAFVVKSAPDGYTLIVNSVGPIAVNPTLYKSLPFNPLTDLDPIVQIAEVPNVLVVPASANTAALKDLLAKAKTKQGGLSYSSTGVGTSSHLSGFMFAKRANITAAHNPAEAVVGLLAGKVDFMFATIPSVMTQINAGKLVPIAVTSAKRSKALPNVPTMIESGYPGFEAGSWFGFFGPKGTPKNVVDKLNKAVNEIIDEPAIDKKMVAEGANPVGGSPEQFKSFIASEFKKWQTVVKESGATAQ
ncbi:MAG: tripartite tricarboxylate transporter substrate binding protein [Deltaproteobacteria bacterium]|nr:tripartite tricarboxylate transporter substrate binding protein [Deltaproteobacteria bacterium]